MKKQSGVTLTEAAIVLAILSILGGFAAPMFENWESVVALRAEVSTLVGELHKARYVAIRSNEYVVFYYTDSGYKIFIDDGLDGGLREDWNHQSGEQMLSDVTFGKGVKIDLAESTFTSQRTRFSGSPGVKAGAVVLHGCCGNNTKIVVNSIGRVRVEKL